MSLVLFGGGKGEQHQGQDKMRRGGSIRVCPRRLSCLEVGLSRGGATGSFVRGRFLLPGREEAVVGRWERTSQSDGYRLPEPTDGRSPVIEAGLSDDR